MTRNRVELGAPSLTGGVVELITKSFAGCVYPVDVEVVNRMPHDIALSEVRGMYLRSVAVSDGSNCKVVRIESEDQFVRFASSVQQIAVLNGHDYVVMTVTLPGNDEPEPEPELKPEPELESDSCQEKAEDDCEDLKDSDSDKEPESEPAIAIAASVAKPSKEGHKKGGKSHSTKPSNGG